MASEADHVAQAGHNEALAQELGNDLIYKDWLITVAFYAAIHYVEASLARGSGRHCDTDRLRPRRVSIHKWREDLVRSRCTQRCWRSYRALKNESMNARYLKLWSTSPGMAVAYYSDNDALHFFQTDLPNVKRGCGY